MANTLRLTRIGAWLIPLSYSAGGLAAGVGIPLLSDRLLPGLVSSIGVGSALTIYSAIASGTIALTGIVFSLTFVFVQCSASVYSPRLVFWVARDPVMSHALGVFSATSLYAVSAAAWVDRGGSGRVPLPGVAVATLLLVASTCMFVALTQRVSVLQVNRMLMFTADWTRAAIERVYRSDASRPPRAWTSQPAGVTSQTLSYDGGPRYLQEIDAPALIALARDADVVIEIVPAVGDVLLDSSPLARVRGDGTVAEQSIRRALLLGDQRAFDQDPRYGIRLLVDIAIRALSPAVNDPTTAVQALDQIADLLLRLGRRQLDISARGDAHEPVRLVVACPTWADYLELALEEIRYCGATSVQVMRRMNAVIADLIVLLPAERTPALLDWRTRIRSTIERTFPDPQEKLAASREDRQGLGGARVASGGVPA